MEYIAFDSHKHYTWVRVEDEQGRKRGEGRIDHEQGALLRFLQTCEPGSPVAVETVGNGYWIVDEIEQAGRVPRLVHAGKAKRMLGALNKTDKLDAQGLNRLQRTGTLPTVWIPPGPLRDARELSRARMGLAKQRVQLKNRARFHNITPFSTLPALSIQNSTLQGQQLKLQQLACPPKSGPGRMLGLGILTCSPKTGPRLG